MIYDLQEMEVWTIPAIHFKSSGSFANIFLWQISEHFSIFGDHSMSSAYSESYVPSESCREDVINVE